nr:GtrA family protein [Pseudactinotalea sp. HY160]
MRRLILVRHRHNWRLLLRFGVVGASGVLVNMGIMVLLTLGGPDAEQAAIPLVGTQFNVRWYHVFSVLAFLVANLWNFQLNRSWAFGTAGRTPWWREYWPFLAVGALGQAIGLALLTLLMHTDSPIHLSTTLLDDSTLLRTRVYWAQFIMIAVVTPVTFTLNKVWTFHAMRAVHRAENEARAEARTAPERVRTPREDAQRDPK